MVKKYHGRFVVLGVVAILLSGCVTCKTPYHRELSNNPNLSEANTSYKKAMHWLEKAECPSSFGEREKYYTTAESYLSDAIFKLNEQGHNNNIDVSEDVNYCEKIKREIDVQIGQTNRVK